MKKLFWMVLFFPLWLNAETTLHFEPSEVKLGESTHLIIESTQNFRKKPDFSALQENFFILPQESNDANLPFYYDLTLFPRKEGLLSTGEIIAHGKPLQPAFLTVLPSDHTPLPIIFRSHISSQNAYEKGLILYTITLLDGAGLINYHILPPTLDHAQVIPLQMDAVSQKTIDDRTYQVLERKFAIIPETSGPLTIPATELYGTLSNMQQLHPASLYDQGKLFDGLTPLQKGIRLETKTHQIQVESKPATWTGWWLPASTVTISADDSFSDSVSVGDSLTRVIHLSATGVDGTQLPRITQTASQGLKVYPSPEQYETTLTPSGDIQGHLTLSLVLMPTQNGEITIPSVSVPWFNTQTRQMEMAILPSQTLHVSGTSLIEQQPPQQAPALKSKTEPIAQSKPKEAPQKNSSSLWIYFAVGFGIIALILIAFVIMHRHHKSYRLTDDSHHKAKEKPLPDLYPL